MFIIAFAINASTAWAAAEPLEFPTPELKERYIKLSKELRCLVCQNQSLADSNADLAQDLREEVHRLVVSGANDDEVVAFLVDRYGDFVRYRPALNASTILLWVGPLLLLMIGGFVGFRVIRNHAAAPAAVPLEANQHQKAAALLDTNKRTDKST